MDRKSQLRSSDSIESTEQELPREDNCAIIRSLISSKSLKHQPRLIKVFNRDSETTDEEEDEEEEATSISGTFRLWRPRGVCYLNSKIKMLVDCGSGSQKVGRQIVILFALLFLSVLKACRLFLGALPTCLKSIFHLNFVI